MNDPDRSRDAGGVSHPLLRGNWKGRFPFRAGTTSYVLHDEEDNLIRNADFLKDRFDRIQLLFFSMAYCEEIMCARVMDSLSAMKRESGVEYSVHLPLDLDLLNPDPGARESSAAFIARLVRATAPWDPEVYVLHVGAGSDFEPLPVRLDDATRARFDAALEAVARAARADSIFVENTHYDLTYFADIIEARGFGVCMDVGHLMRCGHDIARFTKRFDGRIGEVHLHGFDGAEDHIGLSRTDPARLGAIIEFLRGYRRSLTMEVFNQEDLLDTLACLEDFFPR